MRMTISLKYRLERSLVVTFMVSTILMFAPQAASQQTANSNWTPEALLNIKQVGGVQVSPDGKRVVFSVTEARTASDKSEYLTQIHVADADGGNQYQVTFDEHSSDSPRWSPDGEGIAFLSSRSGSSNVWVMRARGGEARMITDAKTSVSSFKWSPDGKLIAFTATDAPTSQEQRAVTEKRDARVIGEDIKMRRLFVIPVEKDGPTKPQSRLLTSGEYTVGGTSIDSFDYDWSPDSNFMVFMHRPTPQADDWSRDDLSIVEVGSRMVKNLAHTGAAEFSPIYSPDGKWVAYLSSPDPPLRPGNNTVHIIPATGGPSRQLYETFDGNPSLVGWSADSKKLYYTEEFGTIMRLYALPLDGPPEALSLGDGMVYGAALNLTRTMIGFSFETPSQAPEAYVSHLDHFAPVRVSQMNRELGDLPLGRTEVVRWKSIDNLKMEGLLTYPVGYQSGRRYPLLLIIHGGPALAWNQYFIGLEWLYPVAAFASRGYAVLRCNPRGSSGYGLKFRQKIVNDFGGMDFKDLMTGVDQVIAIGVADPERMGVMGWSYGGFMTAWAITHTKRFRAASVGAGPVDWASFTGTTDLPNMMPEYLGGELWDHFDNYLCHSPIFYVRSVSTPTLILHGEQDERVPVSQGYEFYNALKRQGCPVKMVVYPRTTHVPQEPKLLQDIMTRNLEWFDKYVRGSEPLTKRGKTARARYGRLDTLKAPVNCLLHHCGSPIRRSKSA
jgi:dipeptidyl aminopeptidase/acylaminoacyl peptidase